MSWSHQSWRGVGRWQVDFPLPSSPAHVGRAWTVGRGWKCSPLSIILTFLGSALWGLFAFDWVPVIPTGKPKDSMFPGQLVRVQTLLSWPVEMRLWVFCQYLLQGNKERQFMESQLFDLDIKSPRNSTIVQLYLVGSGCGLPPALPANLYLARHILFTK